MVYKFSLLFTLVLCIIIVSCSSTPKKHPTPGVWSAPVSMNRWKDELSKVKKKYPESSGGLGMVMIRHSLMIRNTRERLAEKLDDGDKNPLRVNELGIMECLLGHYAVGVLISEGEVSSTRIDIFKAANRRRDSILLTRIPKQQIEKSWEMMKEVAISLGLPDPGSFKVNLND